MANVKQLTRSFAGGEIAPELHGRLDLTKLQTALALCLNFWVLPAGPVQNRPGFAYVNEVKFSTKKTIIRPFSFNTTQTYILEIGDQYIRVHTMGATLLSGTSTNITGITQANPGVVTSAAHGYANGQWVYLTGIGGMTQLNGRWAKVAGATANTYQLTDLAGNNINTTGYGAYTAGGTATPPLEVATPFLEADLFDIHWTQSADVLSLVHPNYDPRELRRTGATAWNLTTISFVPGIATPAAPTLVVNGAGGKSYSYKTTALLDGTLEESLASPAAATAVADLTVAGNSIGVTPAAVAGAVRYNVYKLLNGLYGYIGQTDGSALNDNNITPDVSKTPAIAQTPFAGASNKPAAVGYFEGRRIFAGTDNKPQNFWTTQSGTESNLGYSIPTRDSDAIALRILSQEVNRIRHVVPAGVLILLTSGGVWKIAPQNSDILTPSSAGPKQESTDGASNVPPILTGRQVLYVDDATQHLRELKYTAANGVVVFDSTDISVMAPHLVDDHTITDTAYVKKPHKMWFGVRDDGRLLGVTYLPEHEVLGWHQHTTDGTFESTAAVKEGTEYPLYVVANRTINGRQVRYIERLHSRSMATQADAFFVDSGATYSGAATSTISGLYHLEGKSVAILADGAEHPNVTVTGGTVTLQSAASKVQIGLPYTSQLQMLPVATETQQALGQGSKLNVNEIWFRVKETMTVKAGPSFTKLREIPARTNEPYDSPPRLKTGKAHLVLDNSWGDSAQPCIQQDRPLPMTILSMVIGVALGG